MNSTKQLIKDSIADKKARIAALEAELALDLAALAVFEGGKKSHKPKKKQKIAKIAKKPNESGKLKLADKMELALESEDIPMTSGEFLKAVNAKFPGTNLNADNWSPQLSAIYRNPKKPFQRLEFPENPSETRFFYGLKKWFANKEWAAAYVKKINAKHKGISNQLKFEAIYEPV